MFVCVCEQTHAESGDSLSVETAGTEGSLVAVASTEVESVGPSRLSHCDDEALASAENENNMNVESENNSSADRSVEASGTADVVTAAENSEVGDLQLGNKQDETALLKTADDETRMTERSDVLELSAEANTNVCETESALDHAVLSSCSDMVIEIQDHEFSDEELQEVGRNDSESSVQPVCSKSSAEQRGLQQSADDKTVTVEQGQKNQPTTRVIRLNRNFNQQLNQSHGTPEYQAESRNSAQSSRRLVEKPADGSQSLGNDASSLKRAKLTVVCRSNDTVSSKPRQVKLGSGSRQSRASQKPLTTQKNLADGTQPATRTGEVSAVKVKYNLSRDSSPATSSKSVADESKSIGRPEWVSEDVTPQLVQTGGGAESDSLSKTQLEILELEMRARAIKAMIRAQEEIEQQESVKKKRPSSGTTGSYEPTEKQLPAPQNILPLSSGSSVRPQSSPSQRRGELRSLQSVIGRNIIKRAKFVARHQRRMATEERFQQRKQFVEHRRLPQAALMASQRTVRLQPDTRLRPMRYVVTTESSPRVVRFPSARFSIPLPFSRRQQQRHFELRGNLAASSDSRDDKRRVLVSSNHRSVRLSSSSRPN